MRQKNWSSLAEVLHTIEQCTPYLILRNYEELTDEKYYMAGHEDIDFLVQDSAKVRRALQARNDLWYRSHDHCFIVIKGVDVKIGLRYVGDGYYDRAWEMEMLRKRRLHPEGFYVMDDEDYFYSLLYHALLQKRIFQEDYRIRLKEMGRAFNIILDKEEDYKKCLFQYLIKCGYWVEYPRDVNVPINYADVPQQLLKGYFRWKVCRYLRKGSNRIYKIYEKMRHRIEK